MHYYDENEPGFLTLDPSALVNRSVLRTASSALSQWRHAEHYEHLLEADCTSWAEEWLKRNKLFMSEAWNQNGTNTQCSNRSRSLEEWGVRCLDIENDGLLFWLPNVNPWVLTLEAAPQDAHPGAFTLEACPHLKAMLRHSEQETHLLFNDGGHTLQILVTGPYSLSTPLTFYCDLSDPQQYEIKPLSLQRLFCLYRQGRLPRTLYPREQKAPQWIRMLRAWDGLNAGARHREIAEVLYGAHAASEGWTAGYRTRIQRLLRAATDMVNGGYLRLFYRRSKVTAPDTFAINKLPI